jgi:zinc transporter
LAATGDRAADGPDGSIVLELTAVFGLTAVLGLTAAEPGERCAPRAKNWYALAAPPVGPASLELRAAIETGACRLPHVASLLELIVEQVADGIDRMADELEDELDAIEDALADRAAVVERKRLAGVRRTSVRLPRHLAGLRAVFHRFERQDLAVMKPELRLAVRRLAPRLDGLDQSILDIRERGHRLQDEISAIMAEETNRHLHIRSVLTALLLPPSLVAGMFGMNLKGMPFAEDENGFLWVTALLLGVSALVYLLMRKIGVLKR